MIPGGPSTILNISIIYHMHMYHHTEKHFFKLKKQQRWDVQLSERLALIGNPCPCEDTPEPPRTSQYYGTRGALNWSPQVTPSRTVK